ncbi:hypothetical protein K2173_027621 [Erythroxylum novogranatense]|uniref:DUF4408 domain-containing protein n=1 Tax=Erythroxylum novogranatense TaxID=1862640 RepID=A0AAV8U2D9_9ROSI|nr:hypothetical protein K2173_027621 [Erythroxylum novogranatense]
MDLNMFQRIHATRRSNKHQVLGNFLLYSLTVLTCSLFCSSPIWFPSLLSYLKIFVFSFLPGITSLLISPRSLFIVGNLIIIALIGESRFLASNLSPSANAYYDEYINQKRSFQPSAISEEKKDKKLENKSSEDGTKVEGKEREELAENLKVNEKEDGDGEDGLPTEELKKRADDFIARVNRQRMLEARLPVCHST